MPMGQLIKTIFSEPRRRQHPVGVDALSAEERDIRKRRWERSDAYKPCTVIYPSGFKRRGVVMDMSQRGVRIRFSERAGLPEQVEVMVDGFREPRMATVAWHDNIDAGLRFRA